MNFTAIIATLELKGILTRDEGEKLVEFLNNKPQSTLLNDAVEQVKELVDKELPVVKQEVKKVKATATKVVEEAKAEAAKIAEAVAADASSQK